MKTIDDWRSLGAIHAIGGHRLFAVDSGGGPGPALLLIHGFPTASWDFAPLYPALAADGRVIAPDLLGFGFSDKPIGHDYRIVEQADLVLDLLGKLGIERIAILAHDYGDSVAQEILARHNEGALDVDLTSVCLLNGGLFPESHRPRFVQKLLLTPLGPLVGRAMSQRAFDRAMRAVFAPGRPPTEDELAGFWGLIEAGNGRRVAHRLIRYIPERARMRERWVGALIEARIPLGLVFGLDDPVSGAHMVARFEEIVGQRHFVRRLEGVGHYPQVEAPAAVLDAYGDFRAGIPRPASAGRSSPSDIP